MPNVPNNRPAGRQRVSGGAGKSVSTHGQGLGTGPVGKSDAYRARREGSGNGNGGGRRASGGGKGKLILFLILAVVVLLGGGKGISGLLGGGNGGNDVTTTRPQQQNGSPAGALQGVLGSFMGNGAYSGGWTGENNTGRLNTEVSPMAREKRTSILGGGRDTVTLMVYLCGTDLESKSGMATNDLKEMAQADPGENVNVIVYTGGCRQWKTQGISNTANQIFKVENGQLRVLEKNAGSGAMTSAATLTDFINYCKKHFPANRNELILWDHGGGTISGFGYDERSKSAGSMTLPNVARAIKNTGVSFDFIGFDACLIATLETALVLDPVADYLIASEETEPGIGWYYTNWLRALDENTSIPTVELGKMIADDFVSVCAQRCPGQKATLSVIDLAELSQTADDSLSAFSDATAKQITGSGYKTVSTARANTREFGASSRIDQVDLVHLALNLNTKASKALANTLLSAVKYNKTGGVTDAYGISAYFPYRSANKVNKAVDQLEAIGFDRDYTDCVKKFASLEVTGQAAGGGSASPFGSLFGSLTGGSDAAGSVTDIVGVLLGGGGSGGVDIASLLGGSGIFDRSLEQEELVELVENTRIDNDTLVWTKQGDTRVLKLTEKQWKNVADLQLNVFLDDGKGYIDLGLDNIFTWTDEGDLVGEYDNMWIALNKQPVAYYFTDQTDADGESVTTGRIPVLLNGDRAELIVVFEDGKGRVAGARFVYADGETDTAPKSFEALNDGDKIQPICDRYAYDGEYSDTFKLGDVIVVDGEIEVSDVTLAPEDGKPVAAYMLRDRFDMEHWTPAMD